MDRSGTDRSRSIANLWTLLGPHGCVSRGCLACPCRQAAEGRDQLLSEQGGVLTSVVFKPTSDVGGLEEGHYMLVRRQLDDHATPHQGHYVVSLGQSWPLYKGP
jgi:hypothetical protein